MEMKREKEKASWNDCKFVNKLAGSTWIDSLEVSSASTCDWISHPTVSSLRQPFAFPPPLDSFSSPSLAATKFGIQTASTCMDREQGLG